MVDISDNVKRFGDALTKHLAISRVVGDQTGRSALAARAYVPTVRRSHMDTHGHTFQHEAVGVRTFITYRFSDDWLMTVPHVWTLKRVGKRYEADGDLDTFNRDMILLMMASDLDY